MSDLIKGLMDTCATLEAVLHKTEGERDGLLLQVKELKAALATIVGECATLDEAVMVANKALGDEGVR
jgi:hypothetical protein